MFHWKCIPFVFTCMSYFEKSCFVVDLTFKQEAQGSHRSPEQQRLTLYTYNFFYPPLWSDPAPWWSWFKQTRMEITEWRCFHICFNLDFKDFDDLLQCNNLNPPQFYGHNLPPGSWYGLMVNTKIMHTNFPYFLSISIEIGCAPFFVHTWIFFAQECSAYTAYNYAGWHIISKCWISIAYICKPQNFTKCIKLNFKANSTCPNIIWLYM